MRFGFIFMPLVGSAVAFVATTPASMPPTTTVQPSEVTTPPLPSVEETILEKKVVNRVAVAGATGRTGRWVVQELLNRGVEVVAIVRDLEKAAKELPEPSSLVVDEDQNEPRLTIQKCDLTSETEIAEMIQSCDAAIWCATGFSESPAPAVVVVQEDPPFIQAIKRWMNILPQEPPSPPPVTRTSIDLVGIPALAKCFANTEEREYPKVVMLSSSAVTRPSWDESKKARFPGCADIPIVRLNPFGILGIKAESEELLRQSGTPYCIVRPTGLNDENWPAGCRPLLSQGDVAVGRIHRKDVARILVDVLFTREATGKTFEAMTLAGYPPAESIAPALKRLKLDTDGLPDGESLDLLYATMQQLLPGEKQDSANIALGQTYEQMDKNVEGRFGPRGEERVEQVKLKPSS